MISTSTRKVSVVIPTWQRGDLLRKCLESLRQQTFSDFETVLVSNGAGPWAEELAEEFGCALVRFPTNRGFAAAVNAGIAASQSPYVAVLNDDVELDRNWLKLTAGLLDTRPDISFCCGKIYQADGMRLDNVGDALSLGGSAWRLGFEREDRGQFDSPRLLQAVSGTAALFRRSAFELAGGLDEVFFAYLEDVEWSFRAARKGLQGLYLPEATCLHHGSATLGRNSALLFQLQTRNQLLLLAKHYPWQWFFCLGHRIGWAQLIWLFVVLQRKQLRAYCIGLFGFLRLLSKAFRERRRWLPEKRKEVFSRLRNSEWEIYADVTAPDRTRHGASWRLYFWFFPPRKKGGALPTLSRDNSWSGNGKG